ncbi:uncharacterized protein At5g48480-like [Vitis riparia]|uniref:uncharacterized protein At5g48480-like n=1 Tax=Vitis riparia TaxID=96939 RepID=UPI00155A6BCC|nr:uncharacterized protein At5g48480-like [Vitis riparia]
MVIPGFDQTEFCVNQNFVLSKNSATKAAAAVTFTAVKPQPFVETPKATDAVQFNKAAFGAEEVNRTMHPKRKADQELPLILSTRVKIGSYSLLVSDLADDSDVLAKTVGTSCAICMETYEVEAALVKAVAAGATNECATAGGESACCGGCMTKLKDLYGFIWLICSPAKKPVDVVAWRPSDLYPSLEFTFQNCLFLSLLCWHVGHHFPHSHSEAATEVICSRSTPTTLQA